MAVLARYHKQRTVRRGAWVARFTKQKRNYRGSTKPTAPTLTSISPSTGVHGAANQTVTCTGTGFVSGQTTVTLNGVDQTTTWVSATSCTFVMQLGKYAAATTVAINVHVGPLITATPRTYTIT